MYLADRKYHRNLLMGGDGWVQKTRHTQNRITLSILSNRVINEFAG
jgi:hypothetical protein